MRLQSAHIKEYEDPGAVTRCLSKALGWDQGGLSGILAMMNLLLYLTVVHCPSAVFGDERVVVLTQ